MYSPITLRVRQSENVEAHVSRTSASAAKGAIGTALTSVVAITRSPLIRSHLHPD